MATKLDKIVDNLMKNNSTELIIKDLLEFLNYNNKKVLFNWHPLGFVHSKLYSSPGIGDLRLHVWLENNRNTQTPEMPIHDHVFIINSCVLSGCIINRIYNIGSKNGQKYRLYQANYDNLYSNLEPTATVVKARHKETQKYRKGDFYTIEKGVYHETIVASNEFSATLVLTTEKDEIQSPKILGPVNANTFSYSRSQCEIDVISILNNKLS